MKTHVSCKRIGNVMVSVVVHGAIDRGFVCRLGQIKDYEINVCCFSAKHTVLYLNHLLLSFYTLNKGNNKITELRTILQRESQNS
jgi:hypothetical protein